MTPTQAQIEAAAKAMEHSMFAPHELPLDDELHGKYLATAKDALTAAAQVGVPDQEHILQKPGQKSDLLPGGNTAAEVGESKIIDTLYWPPSALAAINATIERCARVAASYQGYGGGGYAHHSRTIAAAIRALKDKP